MTKPPSNVTPIGAGGIGARLRNSPVSEPPRKVLPDKCPVHALGVQGDFYHYLDAKAQLREVKFDKHSRSLVVSLFAGDIDYLLSHRDWQRRDEVGNIKGIRPEAISDALMRAASFAGVWSPDGRVRGRGAWAGADGDLVLHLGDRLWIHGKTADCGMRGENVYPVLPARPHPAAEPQPGGAEGPAARLHTILRSWRWDRPGIDDQLLLGWICAAMLGGALAWRPAAWVTGDRGTGKSTLHSLLRDLFVYRQGIITVTNTTEAGLRAALQHDALPCAIDEMEAKADNTRAQSVLDLARDASSGGETLRSSSDHGAHSFTIRSAMLFSSINVPPMPPQNRSRIAFLQLQKLKGGRPPSMAASDMRELGQQLLRRMADMWPHWPARLETWREQLQGAGYDARQADQFGTLLAAADIALNDDPPDGDTLADTVRNLVDTSAQERAEEVPDWAACLQHLATAIAPTWRSGEQRTVGTLLAIAAGLPVIRNTETGDDVKAAPDVQAGAANMLATVGLRVMPLANPQDRQMIAVANIHTGLNSLFANTRWASAEGMSGVWRQALLRCPGATPSETNVKFRGVGSRAVLVPLAQALGEPIAPTLPE